MTKSVPDQQWLTLESKELVFLALFQEHITMEDAPQSPLIDSLQIGRPYYASEFCYLLQHHYTSAPANGFPDDPEWLKVTNVKIYKSSCFSRHEVVIFTVINGPLGPGAQASYFSADRNADIRDLPLCLSSKAKRATDVITRIPSDRLQGRKQIVWEINLGDNTTLLRLVHIFAALSEHSETYSLLSHNCLWYSGAIRRILAGQPTLHAIPNINDSSCCRWWFWLGFGPSNEDIGQISNLALGYSASVDTARQPLLRLYREIYMFRLERFYFETGHFGPVLL